MESAFNNACLEHNNCYLNTRYKKENEHQARASAVGGPDYEMLRRIMKRPPLIASRGPQQSPPDAGKHPRRPTRRAPSGRGPGTGGGPAGKRPRGGGGSGPPPRVPHRPLRKPSVEPDSEAHRASVGREATRAHRTTSESLTTAARGQTGYKGRKCVTQAASRGQRFRPRSF